MKNRFPEILIVEDDPLDVLLTKEILDSQNFRKSLHIVDNGMDAMDFLHKKGKYKSAPTPDIILLDLNLPKKDGREVLIDIKHNDKLKSIPVVILTSSEMKEDIRLAYDNYANSYVAKPLDLEQFANIIRTLNNYWLSLTIKPN